METILTFRQPDTTELKVIAEKLRGTSCIAVVGPGIQIENPEIRTLQLPSNISSEANQELLNSILALGDKQVGNQTISEILNPGHFPIWHYQRFRIYFKLRPLFVLRKAVEYYQLKGHKITVYCDAGSVRSLKGKYDTIDFITGPPVKKAKLNFPAIFNYLIYFKIKVLFSLFIPPDYKNKKHLIIDRSVRQLCRHTETLRLKYDNYTLSNLLDDSGDDFIIITETEQPKTKGTGTFKLKAKLFSGLGRRRRSISGEYILFKGLLSPGIYRDRKKMMADLEEKIQRVNNTGLNETENLIFDAFIGLAPTNSYFVTRFLAYRQFFRKHGFITVSAIDENSPSTRCILDAARSTGAKTIGIQHGNIGDAQPAYLYTENDRKNHIMADLTLVWGDYWREFLVNKGNFPDESVMVTGQIRTDIIPKLLANPAGLKEEFAATKPIAVFASQPIPDPVIRRKAAYDVFSAFVQLQGYELIVKLHPGEKDAIDYYREIAMEAGCEDYRLLYDVDLYSLLAVSDLVITCYSTVGTEAVYFGKPLIILDHLKRDLLGYHAAGVAWQALDATDLIRLATDIQEHKLQPDENAMARFIQIYAFGIDGHSTDRTLQIIRGVKSGISR